MANFQQRESGWWQCRIRLKGMPAVSKSFPNRKLAEAWAKVRESEMLRGVYVARDDAERTTFKDVAEKYRDEILPAKRSGVRDTYKVNQLIEEFGSLALTSITPARLSAFRDARLKDGLAPQTVVHELGMVSRILKAASLDWGISLPSGNPVAEVRKPRLSNGRDRRLLPSEESLLIAACRQSKLKALPLVVQFAIETAARQSEILSLDWADVDLRACTARLRGEGGGVTKNNSEFREVPLSPRALDVLREAQGPARRIRGAVFGISQNSLKKAWQAAVRRARLDYLEQQLTEKLATRLTASDVKREIHKVMNRGGRVSPEPPKPATRKAAAELEADPMLMDLHFHDLRHEATSRLAEIFQLHELMKITGHGDSKMLARYYHPRAEDLAKRFRSG